MLTKSKKTAHIWRLIYKLVLLYRNYAENP